jgi:hypothetical protein
MLAKLRRRLFYSQTLLFYSRDSAARRVSLVLVVFGLAWETGQGTRIRTGPKTKGGFQAARLRTERFRPELFGLVCMAFAVGVFAGTIDVRHLFHRFALDAAVLARSCQAGTNWVSALLRFRSFHNFSPGFGSRTDDPRRYLRLRKKVLLYTLGQVANLARRTARTRGGRGRQCQNDLILLVA